MNKNNSTDKIYLNPKIHNKYIMKLKLLKEIYIYNIKEKRLEIIKDFKKKFFILKKEIDLILKQMIIFINVLVL